MISSYMFFYKFIVCFGVWCGMGIFIFFILLREGVELGNVVFFLWLIWFLEVVNF